MCTLIQYLGFYGYISLSLSLFSFLFFFLLFSLMFEHDCLDTCCFGCLIHMCFAFLYLHLFSEIEHASHGRRSRNTLITIIIIINVTLDILLSYHVVTPDIIPRQTTVVSSQTVREERQKGTVYSRTLSLGVSLVQGLSARRSYS